MALIDDHTGMPRSARKSGTTDNVGNCDHATNSALLRYVTVASGFSRT